MAAEIQPLQPAKLAAGPSSLTSEQKYWLTFSSPLLLSPSQSSSPITSITVPSPPIANTAAALTAPQELFAVTSGPRIQIISTRTRKVVKTIARFGVSDVARSGSIRSDGRILVAGGDSGAIQAFDLNSRAILKTWKEHKQPVWVTRWDPRDITRLMSCSDDKSVRLWDLPAEKSLHTFIGHQDYVRCGAYMPGQSGVVVTGSYDQTVRLWDARAGERAVMVFKHKEAIEAVLPLHGGTSVAASSGNQVSILDVVAGKPIRLLQNHQKTVTSLALASGGERLLTGGLDGHVKIFETSGWNVVAGMKYPSPVLSLAVVPSGAQREDKHIAVGMQSGVLSIKTRLSGQQKVQAREREREMKALLEGRIDEYDKSKKRKRGKGWNKRLRGKDFTGEDADIVIEGNPTRGRVNEGTPWGQALRWGDYAKALDLVLEQKDPSYRAHQLTILLALRHRSALHAALSNRDELTLQPILRWLIKNVSDYRITRLTTDVGLLVLDLYGHQLGRSPDIDSLFDALRQRVNVNMEASNVALSVKGMVDMLMAEAEAGE